MACDPQTLLNAARCYLCLTEEQRALINLMLLCRIASASSETGLLLGLVAYWTMNEASSITRQDAHTGNRDLAVGGPAGVPAGAGIISNAASFGGVASPNTNYLTNAAGWHFPLGFTVTVWLKFTAIPAVDQSILGPYTYAGLSNGWQLVLVGSQSNNVALRSSDGNVPATDQAINPTLLSAGIWYFVSAIFDGANARVRVNNGAEYVDQHLAANASGLPLIIGSDITNIQPMNGLVDELGIWSRQLSDAELTAIFNVGAGLTYPFT